MQHKQLQTNGEEVRFITKEKGKHIENDQEACGDMQANLLPLSVGLTLIHWSRDHELLAWSRPGVL